MCLQNLPALVYEKRFTLESALPGPCIESCNMLNITPSTKRLCAICAVHRMHAYAPVLLTLPWQHFAGSSSIVGRAYWRDVSLGCTLGAILLSPLRTDSQSICLAYERALDSPFTKT